MPSTPGDPFTIVAIPDTQNYTYLNRQGTMTQQTQWAVNTRDQLDTAFVVQLGDLVSEEENLTQWGYTSGPSGCSTRPGCRTRWCPATMTSTTRPDRSTRSTSTSRRAATRRPLDARRLHLRRLPRPEPVRSRPDRSRQLRQLLPLHRRRHRFPRAEPRVGGAAVRTRLGGPGARRAPRSHRHHGHPLVRDHERHPAHRRRTPRWHPASDAVDELRRTHCRSSSC